MQYRVQVLVLQSELQTNGAITNVEYQSYGAYANGQFYQFEMRLCHTPLAELGTNFQNNYGGNTPVLVGAANPYVINVQTDEWYGVACSPTFAYNNSDNLIVEVRWLNTQLSTKCEVWSWTAPNNRLLIHKDYNATDGEVGPKTNRLRFTFEGAGVAPTSLGRLRALYR